MTKLVIDNLRPSRPHRFIFIILQDHIDSFAMDKHLRAWQPDCLIVPVQTVTQGTACTVLLAREHINTNDPLMIANCDQLIDADIDDYLAHMDKNAADGIIMTMWADDPKWSYCRFNDQSRMTEVVEKQVVSVYEATVGIYNYRQGSDFVAAAEAMIAQNLRVNGEFYVAPAYNPLIEKGQKILHFNVGREYDGMYGLGIPKDLDIFTNLADRLVTRLMRPWPNSKAAPPSSTASQPPSATAAKAEAPASPFMNAPNSPARSAPSPTPCTRPPPPASSSRAPSAMRTTSPSTLSASTAAASPTPPSSFPPGILKPATPSPNSAMPAPPF